MNLSAKKEIISAWASLRRHFPLHPIDSEKEYDLAVEAMNDLLDLIGSDESHPLADLLHTLGGFMKDYETQKHAIPEATGVACLRFLMEQHGMKQADLASHLGGQSVVSSVLAGKRELNINQIRSLASFFHVSPAVFV